MCAGVQNYANSTYNLLEKQNIELTEKQIKMKNLRAEYMLRKWQTS